MAHIVNTLSSLNEHFKAYYENKDPDQAEEMTEKISNLLNDYLNQEIESKQPYHPSAVLHYGFQSGIWENDPEKWWRVLSACAPLNVAFKLFDEDPDLYFPTALWNEVQKNYQQIESQLEFERLFDRPLQTSPLIERIEKNLQRLRHANDTENTEKLNNKVIRDLKILLKTSLGSEAELINYLKIEKLYRTTFEEVCHWEDEEERIMESYQGDIDISAALQQIKPLIEEYRDSDDPVRKETLWHNIPAHFLGSFVKALGSETTVKQFGDLETEWGEVAYGKDPYVPVSDDEENEESTQG